MPAPQNLSFESGASGVATSWSAVAVGSYEDLAPTETFESGWSNDTALFAFVGYGVDLLQPALTSLYATPQHIETFEELWSSNETAQFSLASAESAVFDGGGAETFEGVSWNGGVAYATSMGATASASAETFESNTWIGGVAFLSAFVGIGTDLVDATIGALSGPAAYEAFESVRAALPTYADVSTGLLHTAGHPYSNTDSVFFRGATLPAPLGEGVEYFARDVTAAVSFRVAETSGGAAIVLTTTGSADLEVAGDPRLCWDARMGSL